MNNNYTTNSLIFLHGLTAQGKQDLFPVTFNGVVGEIFGQLFGQL